MHKTIEEEVTTVKTRKARISDISGREIPANLHWGAVTVIDCTAYDHGHTGGNPHCVFTLDLMPEEMAELRAGIARLISSMRSKYQQLTR